MIWVMLAAYLCGSIPFGLMIVRAVAGVDLRTIGSGNIGASNVGRAAGKTWAAIVLLLDALKGAVPTWAAPWLAMKLGVTLEPQTAQVLGGTCAIIGHIFPVWLGFRGGKGVATALGVVSVLAPAGTVVSAVTFLTVFAVSRIVSLSSLAAVTAFGIFQIWLLRAEFDDPKFRALVIFSIAAPSLILVRHAGNIARLLRGKEAIYKTSSEAERTIKSAPPTQAATEPKRDSDN